MGFCLAEIGLRLVVPATPAAFAASLPNLGAFAITFLFIAVLWWLHHKLFVTYFVLRPLTVGLNFVLLGTLALAVYFQSVFATFVLSNQSLVLPTRLWMAALALVYATLTALYGISIALRFDELNPEDLRWGVMRAFRGGVLAVSFGVVGAFAYSGEHALAYAGFATVVLLGIVRRIVVPRLTERLLARRERPS